MFNKLYFDTIYMKDEATEKALDIAKQLYPDAIIIHKGVNINETKKDETKKS